MQNLSALRWIALGLVLVPGIALTGCEPGGSEEELGTIVYEVPDVPGSEKIFPVPDLDPKAKSAQPNDPLAIPAPIPGDAPSEAHPPTE